MILSLLPLLLPALPAAPPQQDEPIYLIQADGVIGADGALIEDGQVMLRGGKVMAVGAKIAAPSSAVKLRLAGVLAPGFVDAWSRVGTEHGVSEASSYLTPSLLAVDALDRDDDSWEARLAHGITAVHLVPAVLDQEGDPIQVLAGWSGVVGCQGRERVMSARARQTIGLLSGPYRSREGGPSSLAGAAEALGAALTADPKAAGEAALVVVDSTEGINAARAALAGVDLAWIAAGDPATFGGALRGQLLGLPVVDDGNWSARQVETWRRLHDAEVRIAFGTGDGGPWNGPGALRTSAMAFARATGDAGAAMAAVTCNAADLAGLGRSYGRLAPGARADLVLWSGHPLDASSRVRSVMIAGRTVWSAAPREGEDEE